MGQIGAGRGEAGGCSVPEAHLPVARGIDIPVGHGLEEFVQPGPLEDVGGQRWGRHVWLFCVWWRVGAGWLGWCFPVEEGESFKARQSEIQIGARAIRQR